MTDKELLELAAKALGYAPSKSFNLIPSSGLWVTDKDGEDICFFPIANCKTGRSQCLQMEIHLKLEIDFSYDGDEWVCRGFMGEVYKGELARHKDRQRASTMAAAEIGKGMK